MTPIEVLSGTFSVVGGAIKLGKFVFKLADVDGETKTSIMLLERVNKDIEAAEELCRLKYTANGSKSRQYRRAIEVIRDTRAAAHELRKLVCVTKQVRVPLTIRIRWVMSDKGAFLHREKTLSYCHKALIQVIGTMEQMDSIQNRSPIPLSNQAYVSPVMMPALEDDVTLSINLQKWNTPSTPMNAYFDTARLDKWRTPSQTHY